MRPIRVSTRLIAASTVHGTPVAARFLRANGASRDLSAALYHYNPSTHYVQGVLAFAGVMAADVRAFSAYYGWRVYVTTTGGTFLLQVGYTG